MCAVGFEMRCKGCGLTEGLFRQRCREAGDDSPSLVGQKGAFVSGLRHLAPWMLALPAAFLALACQAQGNIDAGKSPAQIFAETCAVCHKDARQLRRASVAYLRQHYTSSYEEANALATYVARLPVESRTEQSKRTPAGAAAAAAEAAKQQPRQQPAGADQGKSAQAQSKGRRPAVTAEVTPLPPTSEENPSLPPAEEPPPRSAPPPLAVGGALPAPAAARAAPSLVPFQE
jgi:hypothetical protein